jgi:hypothetical protein
MALATVQDILPTWQGMGWATMELLYGDQTSGQGSGQVIVKNLRDPLWMLHAESKILIPSQLRKWKAILNGLDNGRSLFLGYDFAGFYPILYPRGTWPTGVSFSGTSAAVSAKSGKTITLSGLPAGYSGSIGDFIQVTNSTGSPAKLALLQAAETFTANGSGVTSAFEVRPTVPAWVAAAQAAAVKKAGCHMMIIPGSIEAPKNLNARGSISFDAIQVPIP